MDRLLYVYRGSGINSLTYNIRGGVYVDNRLMAIVSRFGKDYLITRMAHFEIIDPAHLVERVTPNNFKVTNDCALIFSVSEDICLLTVVPSATFEP